MMDARAEARKAAENVLRKLDYPNAPEEEAQLLAALSIDAYEAALEKAGLVLVPREPTEAMIEAGVAAGMEFNTRGTVMILVLDSYRAMIAAAEGR